jgi:hypothetical protein
VKAELQDRGNHIRKIRPTQLSAKKTKIILEANDHQIKQGTLALNETNTKNIRLRREIDMLRKEYKSATDECRKFENLIKQKKRFSFEQNKEYLTASQLADQHNI